MKKYFLLIMMFFFVAVNAQEVSSELITKWDNMYSESYALFNGKQNEKGLESALKLLSFTKTNFDINSENYFYSLFFVSLGYQKVLNYKNSNEYFFELLSYIKEREDYIDLLFLAYSYIGINYVFLKEDINAAEYLKKSNQLIDKYKISDALVYQNTNNYYLDYLENLIQLDILYKEAYGLYGKSNFLEAIKPFKEIIEILKIDSLVNFQSIQYINLELAICYERIGSFETSEKYFQELLTSPAKLDTGFYNKVYLDYAVLLQNKKEYDTALSFLLNAISYYSNSSEVSILEKHMAFYYLSRLYLEMDELNSSIEYAKKCIDLLEENSIKDELSSYNLIASIYNSLGNHNKSLEYRLKLIKAAEASKDINLFIYYSDIALTYSNLFDYENSNKYYLKAMEYCDNNDNIHCKTVYINYSNYLLDIKEFHTALSILLKIEILDSTKLSLLNTLCLAYSDLNKTELALKYAKKTLNAFDTQFNNLNHRWRSTFLSNLALSYQNIKDYSSAFEAFNESNSIRLNQIKNNYTFLTESEKENFNNLIKDGFNTFQSFSYNTYQQIAETIDEDFNIILATNGLLLNNSINIREAIKAQNDTALTTLFNNYTIATKQLDKAYEFTLEQRKTNNIDIEKLQQKAEYLERELVQRTSSFIVYPDYTLGKDDIAKVLEKNEVALQFNSFQYYNGKEWTDSTVYVAFILNNKGALQYIPLFEEATIAPLLEAFSNKEKANEVNQNLSLLYQHIWQPLLPYLKNVENIYYAPSGLLHKVPFVALKDTSHKYLGEQYQLQAVLSTRDIPKLKEQPQQQTNNLLALMGGANFDAFKQEDIDENSIDFLMNMPFGSVLRNIDRSGWLYLKGSLKEVENINALAKNSGNKTILKTGTDASEENFKKIVKEQMPGILHIATHGYYVPPPNEKPKSALQLLDDNNFKSNDNPLLRSGILLSGANQKWVHKQNTDSENDGILTALEISRLDLSKTELVVLSACETGLGDIKGSEGVYGLQRAFKMAGAKRQIVSLWQVPDKETAEMMELFYTYLFNEKLSYSEAFKKAQNTMKQNHPNEPLKWAGFVLVE